MNTGGCAPATPTQRQNLSLKAKIKDQTPAESVKDVLIVVVKDVLILDTFLPVFGFPTTHNLLPTTLCYLRPYLLRPRTRPAR